MLNELVFLLFTGLVMVHVSCFVQAVYIHIYIFSACLDAYPMAFKKFASLMVARRLFLIAFVNSSLASAAFTAPSIDPSPAGRSIVCS